MEKMSTSTCGSVKKRKIPMQKRETKEQRAVTFSKRRAGLFNKAAELCVLCNAQVVLLVSAPLAKREKFYTFAHPDINLLLDAFLNNHTPYPIHKYNNPDASLLSQNMEQPIPRDNKVSKTKKRKRECEGFWWDNDDFDAYQTPEELDLIIGKLEKLREAVALKLQKLSTSTAENISSYGTHNHHGECLVEDMGSDDQSQFMPPDMPQKLSISSFHGGCLHQNMVNIDGYKSNADFLLMLPLKSIMVTPYTNNDGQNIGSYQYDMGATFEAPLFSSNGVETSTKSLAIDDHGWLDDRVATPYIQNEQPSSFFSNDLDHHIGTSFEGEFRNDSSSFLQNSSTTGSPPPFSIINKDANMHNFPGSGFKENSLPLFAESNRATINNDLLFDGDYIDSSATEGDDEFFSFLESFFSS